MATRSDIDADLMLEIDGRDVTPRRFLRGVRAFFGLVDEVTRAIVGPADEVQWAVRVKSGSALVGLVPARSTVAPEVLDGIYATVQRGVEGVERAAEEPERLPPGALKHIRDLGAVAGAGEQDDAIVRVWTRRKAVQVTHKTVAHAAVLLDEDHEDFGTIEGRIQVVSERGDLHVYVTEPIRQRQVRCVFPDEMLPAFLAAFRKRVEITGRIRYRRDGVPVSIAATKLTEFPGPDELPSYKAVRGILRKTG